MGSVPKPCHVHSCPPTTSRTWDMLMFSVSGCGLLGLGVDTISVFLRPRTAQWVAVSTQTVVGVCVVNEIISSESVGCTGRPSGSATRKP